MVLQSIDELSAALATDRYLCDRETATAAYLSLRLKKPLLLEGRPGSGKSQLARSLATVLGARLLVVSCHEDLGFAEAAYEWDRARQLLRIRLAEANHEPFERAERELTSEQYLLRHPILEALRADDTEPPVLLVDEIDRTDDAFEASLVEALTSLAVEIPGLGVLRAKRGPRVIVTANGNRDPGDGLKRASIYRWLDYPDFEREREIVRAHVPGLSGALAGQVCNFVARLRQQPLGRPPGVGEAIAWSQALSALHRTELSGELVDQTLGCLLKDAADIETFRRRRLHGLLKTEVDRAG